MLRGYKTLKTFEIIAFKMKRKCKDCHKKAVVSVGKLCSGCKSLHWLFSCLILCNKIIYMTTMVYIYSIGDQKQNFVCCDQSCEAEILPISLILGENLLFFCCIRLQQLSLSPLTARLSHFLCPGVVTGNFFPSVLSFSF